MTEQSSDVKDSDNSTGRHKLGLISLVTIVVSSVLRGGAFSLPQNTAASSALGPVVIAWIIAGISIYSIANSFHVLSGLHPDLQAGAYMYAREGFGSFIGFNVAWGYWLVTASGNVAFAVVLMDALNQFMPGVFTDGNNLNSITCGLVLTWGYNFLILSGMKVTGFVNTLGIIAKLVPLILFVLLLGVLIDYSDLFKSFWGESPAILSDNGDDATPVSLLSRILAPVTVTLWAFIDVGGTVVLSGCIKDKQDVGKATLIGFLLALVIYMLMSILPFGVVSQVELAQVSNPSTADVLAHVIGQWSDWLMNAGLTISVLADWLAWAMLYTKIPMAAGQKDAFPRAFARMDSKQAANISLWVSSFVMQAAMLLVYFSNNIWTTIYSISALMVVPAYIITTLYLTSICRNGEYDQYVKKSCKLALSSGVLGSLFCLFILYASQIEYIVLIPVLLIRDLPVFTWSRKGKGDGRSAFTREELIYLIMLLLCDIIVVTLFIGGYLKVQVRVKFLLDQ